MQKTNTFVYVLKIFLPLLLICALVAGVISGIQVLTKGAIAENLARIEAEKEQKKLDAIAEIYGEGVSFEKLTDIPDGIDEIRVATDANGKKLATATLTVKGYSDGLQVFVAFGPEGEIKRVMILASNETTGIGSKVSNEDYLKGYEGKQGTVDFADKTDNLDKIAGASISSKAVLGAVNTASEALSKLGYIEKGGN